jgi:hypothetical protein
MAVRLFNFNGQAVKAPGCPVIIYTEKNGIRLMIDVKDFPSYNDAQKFIQENPIPKEQHYAICGFDPFVSPIDLDAVEGYKLIHESYPITLSFMKQTQVPAVKIFEFTQLNSP